MGLGLSRRSFLRVSAAASALNWSRIKSFASSGQGCLIFNLPSFADHHSRDSMWDGTNGCSAGGDTGEVNYGWDYWFNWSIWNAPAALLNKDITALTQPGGLVHRVLEAGNPGTKMSSMGRGFFGNEIKNVQGPKGQMICWVHVRAEARVWSFYISRDQAYGISATVALCGAEFWLCYQGTTLVGP
jgi:hypothetical protein